MKHPQAKEQYLEQLRKALQGHHIDNIEDIIEDYEEYFAHSTAKGYSASESIRRLPSVQELAQSYKGGVDKNRPSRTGRISMFIATLLGELLLLPFAAVAGLFFITIGVAGLMAFLGGILMLVPESTLGTITVPRPPVWQLLPTMTLLMAGGAAVFGSTLIIAERSYNTLRSSIVTKRWMLTGKHDNHLKLVPPISKGVKHVLYMTVLFATLSAFVALLLLTIIALVTTGTPDFLRSWNI